MICRCFGKTLDLTVLLQTAHAMLGIPDYEAYLAHLERAHPELVPLSARDFFRARQAARFGSALRCC